MQAARQICRAASVTFLNSAGKIQTPGHLLCRGFSGEIEKLFSFYYTIYNGAAPQGSARYISNNLVQKADKCAAAVKLFHKVGFGQHLGYKEPLAISAAQILGAFKIAYHSRIGGADKKAGCDRIGVN